MLLVVVVHVFRVCGSCGSLVFPPPKIAFVPFRCCCPSKQIVLRRTSSSPIGVSGLEGNRVAVGGEIAERQRGTRRWATAAELAGGAKGSLVVRKNLAFQFYNYDSRVRGSHFSGNQPTNSLFFPSNFDFHRILIWNFSWNFLQRTTTSGHYLVFRTISRNSCKNPSNVRSF